MNKETIETLKKMVEDGNLSQEIAEKYCPELAESEDERIRKELIWGFKHLPEETFAGISINDVIAWLEKQGEQHPKFRIGDTIKKKSTGDIVTISEIDLKNREYRLSNTGFIPFKYEHLWELVEQKPMNEKSLYKAGYLDGFEDGVRDAVIKEDESADKVEQKSAAWNEEDERIRIETIELLETANHPNKMCSNGKPLDFTENINWLKSLKDRVQPQPQQEWSEEEQQIRDELRTGGN